MYWIQMKPLRGSREARASFIHEEVVFSNARNPSKWTSKPTEAITLQCSTVKDNVWSIGAFMWCIPVYLVCVGLLINLLYVAPPCSPSSSSPLSLSLSLSLSFLSLTVLLSLLRNDNCDISACSNEVRSHRPLIVSVLHRSTTYYFTFVYVVSFFISHCVWEHKACEMAMLHMWVWAIEGGARGTTIIIWAFSSESNQRSQHRFDPVYVDCVKGAKWIDPVFDSLISRPCERGDIMPLLNSFTTFRLRFEGFWTEVWGFWDWGLRFLGMLTFFASF